MKRLAVIPARGGSKRLPRKNAISFEGKPLIAWTIEAARDSGLFDRVIVSTDDEEIAQQSRDSGGEVPFMRTKYADDTSPPSLVTVDALERLAADGDQFDQVVQLFAATPLRTAADICDAIKAFESREANFQLSCYKLGWMRPWWALTLADDGKGTWLFPHALTRSQDLPPIYAPSGATWVARVDALLREQNFYGTGHVYHPMPWQRAVDIDDADDVLMASALFRAGLTSKGPEKAP